MADSVRIFAPNAAITSRKLMGTVHLDNNFGNPAPELELDDLATVVGGLNEPLISLEDWSDKDTSHE